MHLAAQRLYSRECVIVGIERFGGLLKRAVAVGELSCTANKTHSIDKQERNSHFTVVSHFNLLSKKKTETRAQKNR